MRLLLLPFAVAAILGQAPTTGQVIRSQTTEVLLDLVVRDKSERFVRNLKPEEIEVYEDGVRQSIKTFAFIDGRDVVRAELSGAPAGTSVPKPMELNPLREINLVSIVFRAMGPLMRLNAQRAARDFLNQQLGSNTYAAVFSFDYRLNVLQSFTNDPELLRKAVDRAATGAYSQFTRDSLAIEQRLGGGSIGAQWTAQDSGQVLPQSAPGANFGVSAAMDQTLRSILLANYENESYHASIRALLAINRMVQEQSRFPGRKTVLLVAEGLPGHPDTAEFLQMAISTANRNNVSIYGLDPSGLTTEDQNALARTLINDAVSQSAPSVETRPAQGAVAVRSSEAARTALFSNQQEILRQLAEGTGGVLIANTNDIRLLRRIAEDVKTHYEVSYTPANSDFDGRWRALTVKINRPAVQVRTRSGYFGLPLMFGRTLMPFEMATLKALNARPLPRDLSFASRALRFHPSTASVQHSLVVEVPIRDLKLVEDPAAKICRTRVSMTALIKDPGGEVINKISRDIPATAPIERIDELRRGNIIFTTPFTLAPGRYTLETAVIDRESLKTAATRSALIVPANSGFGLGSLSLVRRAESLKAARDAGDPFQSAAGRVTPTLANSIHGATLSVYTVAYPARTVSAAPELMFEVQQQGKVIARSPVPLSAPDESGAIPVLITRPTADLAPGQYEVRVILRQGELAAEEMISVALEKGS